MDTYRLTPEQEAVVCHSRGMHARVLAVAGSGKTTTMVHRVKHLVMGQGVPPRRICILMFNRLARIQFQDKLEEVGIPEAYRPHVNTFHSFAFGIISELKARGWLYGTAQMWVGDREELARRTVHKAITNLVDSGAILLNAADPDEALEAIDLWKGSLIPPDRAGYRGNPHVPLVYKEFERLRNLVPALTYADFVPVAVGALESEESLRREWCNYDFVIVDEYQDVNYGQQRLIELVAGHWADVMVVGDDDQTIYEWRGARPHYILHEFERVFCNKEHRDYTLSHSFRFGPTIAQCAENVISFNTNRIKKPLIAHNVAKPAQIIVTEITSEQPGDSYKDLAQQIFALAREVKGANKPLNENLVVLGRMYCQLSGLETEFLARGIPYRVLGRAPFFERREIQVLLDYVRLAARLGLAADATSSKLLLSVANTPNRMLSKLMLERTFVLAQSNGYSTREALHSLLGSRSFLTSSQRTRADDLVTFIERLWERITQEAGLNAGDLLEWMVAGLDYYAHFDNYYGKGESSEDRKRAVAYFCSYGRGIGLEPLNFVAHVESLDTTRGVPEKDQILMTTVFRTKGLEFDYVVIPACEEGYMPCLFGSGNTVYDTQGIVEEPEPSEIMENERRLFYVAVTRARKGVLIATSMSPRQGSQRDSIPSLPSRFLHEMQHSPTAQVLGALQRLAAKEPGADRAVVTTARAQGGLKAVTGNLIDAYLPGLGENDLADLVRRAVDLIEARPFSYPTAYSAADRLPTQETASRPDWWEAGEGMP